MSERKSDLSELRSELESRHAELVGRVEAITADLRDTPQKRSRDWDDRAQESENDEVLEKLDDQGREEIQQIEIALKRFEAGVYGVCIDCEDEIPLARLRAVPAALRCIECARRLD